MNILVNPCVPEPIRDAHMGLVVKAWLRTWADRLPRLRPLDNLRAHIMERLLLDALLSRPSVVALVARPVDSPPESDHALGFAVGEPARRVLHLVYTRQDHRDHSVATQLLTALFGEPGEPIPTTLVGVRGDRRLRRWRLQYSPGHTLSDESLAALVKQ